MLANISKLWAIYKPSKEFQPLVVSVILTGYLFYKIEFGGEHSAERRAAEKKRRNLIRPNEQEEQTSKNS